MSSARQYDYGKPADTLSEWASKVKSLQTLVDQDDAEERTRLEREIERARSERARRRGKSIDFTTAQCVSKLQASWRQNRY
jgi:Skp family chaperone for outer membrane proteins